MADGSFNELSWPLGQPLVDKKRREEKEKTKPLRRRGEERVRTRWIGQIRIIR